MLNVISLQNLWKRSYVCDKTLFFPYFFVVNAVTIMIENLKKKKALRLQKFSV